jgi:putative SOS response-associated peptidase YedK
MCGRFVLISNLSRIAEEFNLNETASSSVPSGDIHPGQKAACIIAENGKNRLSDFEWGFSPKWLKQTATAKLLINARAETLAEKSTFREAFQRRRCLIAADGFYEWSPAKKQFYFYMQNKKLFGLAGIYENDPDTQTGKTSSFVIITTTPNNLIAPLHNRMPVIIPRDKQHVWLNNDDFEKSGLQSLLVPYPASQMEMRPGPFIIN